MSGEIIEEYPEYWLNPACLIVIKNVPCEECDQCGEIEYSDEVMKRLEMIVNNAKKFLQEFSIIDYAKVA